MDAPKKHPGGRPPKVYKQEEARVVQALAQYAVPQDDIAMQLHMDTDTMLRLYRGEYEQGKAVADSKIRMTLYEEAVVKRNTAALLFICKTRLGMRETNRVEMTSPDGTMTPKGVSMDLSGYTPEQLADMARAAFRGE